MSLFKFHTVTELISNDLLKCTFGILSNSHRRSSFFDRGLVVGVSFVTTLRILMSFDLKRALDLFKPLSTKESGRSSFTSGKSWNQNWNILDLVSLVDWGGFEDWMF